VSLVLLVEDEPALRASMARGIGKIAGVEVRETGAVAEAMAVIDLAPPDLVVSGIDLPDGSGLTLVAELQSRGLDVPILFVSAHPISNRARIPPHARVEVIERLVPLEELRARVLALLVGPVRTSPPSRPPTTTPSALADRPTLVITRPPRSSVPTPPPVLRRSAGGPAVTPPPAQGPGPPADASRPLEPVTLAVEVEQVGSPEIGWTSPPAPAPRLEPVTQEIEIEQTPVPEVLPAAPPEVVRSPPPEPPPASGPGPEPTLPPLEVAPAEPVEPRSPPEVGSAPPIEPVLPTEEALAPSIGSTPPPEVEPLPLAAPAVVPALSFETLWDRGVEAVLERDLARARDAFAAAQVVRPQDRRVLANLKRLADLGFPEPPAGGRS